MIDLRECQPLSPNEHGSVVLNYHTPALRRSRALANASGACALFGSPILAVYVLFLPHCGGLIGWMAAALVVLVPAVGVALAVISMRRSRLPERDVRAIIGLILNLGWVSVYIVGGLFFYWQLY